MSRPIREGLDYFPLDVDFMSDEKVQVLREEHGLAGVCVYVALLADLYRVGMCFRWDALAKRAFASRAGCTAENLQKVLCTMLELGLFDDSVLQRSGFLTSKGIQRRYFQVCELCNRRGIKVPDGVLLIDSNEIPSSVKVEVKGLAERERSKEKENKGKESKVKGIPIKPPNNPQITPIKPPNNPQITPIKPPNNTQETPPICEIFDFGDGKNEEKAIETSLATTASLKTEGEGETSFLETESSLEAVSDSNGVHHQSDFNGYETKEHPDGWRRVGNYTALDPISYENLAITNGAPIVNRAMLLVEGWVLDPSAPTHELDKRRKRAANCVGCLTSWALSKAREQLEREKRSKGKGDEPKPIDWDAVWGRKKEMTV